MIGMGLGLLLLIGLLVVVPVVLLGGGAAFLRNRGHSGNLSESFGAKPDAVSPRELLDARLARGEISVEEYQEIGAEISARKDA